MTAQAADFTEDDRTLRFTGEWTLARLGNVPVRLERLSTAPDTLDLSGVERIDTIGAWLVHRLAARSCTRGSKAPPTRRAS